MTVENTNGFPAVMLGVCEERDETAVKARVRFAVNGESTETWLSPWLPVMQNYRYMSSYTGVQKTDTDGACTTGAGGEESHTHDVPAHSHAITCKPWLPNIGQTVVVLWLPVWQGEGIVIGTTG